MKVTTWQPADLQAEIESTRVELGASLEATERMRRPSKEMTPEFRDAVRFQMSLSHRLDFLERQLADTLGRQG